MSELFKVYPQGLGTSEVESLSSVIIRLAAKHRVTVGRILRYCHDHSSKQFPQNTFTESTIKRPTPIATWIRPNEWTKQLYMVAKHATGIDELRSTTLLSIQDAVSRSRESYSQKLRWCPMCFKEQARLGRPTYFKLAWHLKPILRCELHGLLLREECPFCRREQVGTGYYGACNICKFCNKDLSEEKLSVQDFGRDASGYDLFDLVETISTEPELVFPKNSTKKIVAELFEQAWKLSDENKYWKIIPRDECIAIALGDKPVTLSLARKIAFRFGVPLTSLFRGDLTNSTINLDNDWTNTLPVCMKPLKRIKRHKREELLNGLDKVKRKYEGLPPPSFAQVAREIQVSKGALAHHFPSIVRDMVDSHKKWQIDTQSQLKLKARSLAVNHLLAKRGKGFISKKSIIREIREVYGIPKNKAIQAVAWAFETVIKTV